MKGHLVYVCRYVCTCIQTGIFLYYLTFLRLALLLNPELINWLYWLASTSQVSSCLCLPAQGLEVHTGHAQISHVSAGDRAHLSVFILITPANTDLKYFKVLREQTF